MGAEELELTMIRRAAEGDSAALQWFLLRYRKLLLHYVGRHLPARLRDFIGPEDVVQDVYLAASAHKESFVAIDVRSARRWLVTIARNRIITLSRTAQAQRHGGKATVAHEADLSEDSLAAMLQDLAVYQRTPSQSAVAHELRIALQRSIAHLPPDYGQAVRLRYVEGLAFDEIASRMNRTPHAVHMLCNRGLKSLRLEMRTRSLYL